MTDEMTADGPSCDWDAESGLLILRLPAATRAEPVTAALWSRARDGAEEAGDPDPGALRREPGRAARRAAERRPGWRRRILRAIAPEERLAVFRAPDLDAREASSSAGSGAADIEPDFELALFVGADPELHRLESARWRFAFRSDLRYDPLRPETAERRTRIRYFWPTGELETLAEAPGPTLARGARPGAVLARVAEEHRAGGHGAFAASAAVTDGRAVGPTVRALPDEGEPLAAEIGWLEESFADVFAALDRPAPAGFETSRFPLIEIDLTAYGPAAPDAARAVWFVHIPLGPQGYRGDETRLEQAAPEQSGDGRWILTHAWDGASHRDLLGVWSGLGRPLRLSGLLPVLDAVSEEEGAPARDDALAAGGALLLYLGEVARDALALAAEPAAELDLSRPLGAPEPAAAFDAEERAAVREAWAEIVETGARLSGHADRGAARLGLDWAEDAALGPEAPGAPSKRRSRARGRAAPDPSRAIAAAGELLRGARHAAPEAIAAFFETRARMADALADPQAVADPQATADPQAAAERAALTAALAALDLDLHRFERFAESGDAALALAADPALAALAAEGRRPLRLRPFGGDDSLGVRIADALCGGVVARRWAEIEAGAESADPIGPRPLDRQRGLWRMLAAGADLDALVASGLDFDAAPPPPHQIAVAARIAAPERLGDRLLAAKVIADLDDPAIRRRAVGLEHPTDIAEAVNAAAALDAARAAVRADLERLAAAAAVARAPGPRSFDAVWDQAARIAEGGLDPSEAVFEAAEIAAARPSRGAPRFDEGEGPDALEGRWARVTELELSRIGQQVGGPAMVEALEGLVTRLGRWEAHRALAPYEAELSTLGSVYRALGSALWCEPALYYEEFERRVGVSYAEFMGEEDDERRRPLIKEVQREFADLQSILRVLGEMHDAAQQRGKFSRINVVGEIDALRVISVRGGRPVAPPSWGSALFKGLHAAFVRVGQKCLQDAAGALQQAPRFVESAPLADTEADLRAFQSNLQWIAARHVWRFICMDVEELAANEAGRLGDDARRLALRLGEPPENWAEIDMELQALLRRQDRRDEIREVRSALDPVEPIRLARPAPAPSSAPGARPDAPVAPPPEADVEVSSDPAPPPVAPQPRFRRTLTTRGERSDRSKAG